MSGKSFYDLDYIIEVNEQRLEQYISAYHEVLQKLTNIILIYSAIAIFLISIIKEVFWQPGTPWFVVGCLIVFAILFGRSIYFTVRFIIPRSVHYPGQPRRIYDENRNKYEQVISEEEAIENMLKASYINELEEAINANFSNYTIKFSWYYKALMYALLSVVPYLVCFGYFIANQNSQEIVTIKSNK